MSGCSNDETSQTTDSGGVGWKMVGWKMVGSKEDLWVHSVGNECMKHELGGLTSHLTTVKRQRWEQIEMPYKPNKEGCCHLPVVDLMVVVVIVQVHLCTP